MLSLSIIIKNILKNYVTKSEKQTINDEILLLQDEVKKLKTDLLEKQGVIETLRKQVTQLQTDTTALQTNNTNVQATVNSFYNAKNNDLLIKVISESRLFLLIGVLVMMDLVFVSVTTGLITDMVNYLLLIMVKKKFIVHNTLQLGNQMILIIHQVWHIELS